MQCECWVWMAVRHSSVSHIISWISFVMWLKPIGCRPVNHSSYHMKKHRPWWQCVESVCFTVYLVCSEWLESKRDLWCFNAQSSWLWSLLPCVSDEVLSFTGYFFSFHTISDVCATAGICVCMFFCVAVRQITGLRCVCAAVAESYRENIKTEKAWM